MKIMGKCLILVCTKCQQEFVAIGAEIDNWEAETCQSCGSPMVPKFKDKYGRPITSRYVQIEL